MWRPRLAQWVNSQRKAKKTLNPKAQKAVWARTFN